MGLGGMKGQGCGEKLHSKELNDLYCSPVIDRVMKSRRRRWAGM
jgi:hypothetical protein